MGVKTPPFKHHPAWTTARFWGFIRSGLRKMFSRYPVKYQVMKDAGVDTATNVKYKTGQRAGMNKTVKMFPCAMCGKTYRQLEVQVDHIVPAGSLQSYDDVGPFVQRLFCGPDGLQVLCKSCHVVKTKRDRDESKTRV